MNQYVIFWSDYMFWDHIWTDSSNANKVWIGKIIYFVIKIMRTGQPYQEINVLFRKQKNTSE